MLGRHHLVTLIILCLYHERKLRLGHGKWHTIKAIVEGAGPEEVSLPIGKLVFLQHRLIQIEDEEHLLKMGLKLSQVARGKRHVLMTELLCRGHVPLLIYR